MAYALDLKWRNDDSTTDLNARLASLVVPGIVVGADVTPSGVDLTCDVSACVAINIQGAKAISDDTVTVTVTDGEVNVIYFHARHVQFGSPELEIAVEEESAYNSDPNKPYRVIIAKVDLTSGPNTFPPPSSVLLADRESVDPVTRLQWRPSVATLGDLPDGDGNPNKDGDVTLVRAEGTLYVWVDSSQTWEVFDQVSLTSHMTHDHVNGITGDSATTTLTPSASNPNIVIAAVPVGSGYDVGGKYLTAVTGSPIAASTVGTDTHTCLIQVVVDDIGALSASYRVTRATSNITAATIVDISSDHEAGVGLLMEYDDGDGTLRWNGGTPVAVVTGNTYKLYSEDSVSYVTVSLSGALPGSPTTDTYTVLASDEDETHFLLAHYTWDNVTLVMATDRRTFGTLGDQNLSDHYKQEVYYPAFDDLRGSCVLENGVMSDLGSNLLGVTGPIVGYIEGQRFVVAASDTGLSVPSGQTRYIYVRPDATTGAPVLTANATDPASQTAFPFAYIGVAINTAGTIAATDGRVAVLSVRPAEAVAGDTVQTKVVFSNTADNGELALEATSGGSFQTKLNGAATGTDVTTESIYAENVAATVGPLTLADALGTSVALGTADDNDIDKVMSNANGNSLVGALRDGVRTTHAGLGVESGCAFAHGSGSNFTIAAGVFYDWYGRRIERTSESTVTLTDDGTFVIYWDASASSGVGAFTKIEITSGVVWNQDLPFGIAVRAGGSITDSESVVMTNGGQRPLDGFIAGTTAASTANAAHFSTLRTAMLHANCYETDAQRFATRTFLVGVTTETDTIDDSDALFGGVADVRLTDVRLKGVRLRSSSLTTSSRVSWGADELFLGATGGFLQGVDVEGVGFRFTGSASAGDAARTAFRVACADMTFRRCTATGPMTHFVLNDDADVGTLTFRDCVASDTRASVVLLSGTEAAGCVHFSGGSYAAGAASVDVVRVDDPSPLGGLNVVLDGGVKLTDFASVFVGGTVAPYAASITDAVLLGVLAIADQQAMASLARVTFLPGVLNTAALTDLDGVRDALGLQTLPGASNQWGVKAGPKTSFVGCNLTSSEASEQGFSYFDASDGWAALRDSTVCLGGSTGSVGGTFTTADDCVLSNVTVVFKPDGAPSTGTWLTVSSGDTLLADNVRLTHSGTSGSSAAISIVGTGRFVDCTVPHALNTNVASVSGKMVISGGSWTLTRSSTADACLFGMGSGGSLSIRDGAQVTKVVSGGVTSTAILMRSNSSLEITGEGTVVSTTGAGNGTPVVATDSGAVENVTILVTSGATVDCSGVTGNALCVAAVDTGAGAVNIDDGWTVVIDEASLLTTLAADHAMFFKKDGDTAGTNRILLRNPRAITGRIEITDTKPDNKWTSVDFLGLRTLNVPLDVTGVAGFTWNDGMLEKDTTGDYDITLTDIDAMIVHGVTFHHHGADGVLRLLLVDVTRPVVRGNTLIREADDDAAQVTLIGLDCDTVTPSGQISGNTIVFERATGTTPSSGGITVTVDAAVDDYTSLLIDDNNIRIGRGSDAADHTAAIAVTCAAVAGNANKGSVFVKTNIVMAKGVCSVPAAAGGIDVVSNRTSSLT